jgi:very-short-patch-repair endonuclease
MRSHNQQRQARSALLVIRARRMLHAPTPSEEALWQALRGGVLGVAFKRQVVLGGRYIADFFAPSVGLVVEVDGGVHRSSRAADRRRDERLQRLAIAWSACRRRSSRAALRRRSRWCTRSCRNSYT